MGEGGGEEEGEGEDGETVLHNSPAISWFLAFIIGSITTRRIYVSLEELASPS